MTYRHQRITFFADDDVTPLLGAVSGGLVTDPSFSTDPGHSRPYLIFQEMTGSAEINFAEGSSSIGQVNVEIGDKRQDPLDQATGIYTWLQVSGVTGTTQTLRRRVLWEQLRPDGITWETLLNGILFATSLNDDLVSYTLALRDIRERERAVRLFIKNNDAVQDPGTNLVTVNDGTCVFPYVGPMNGWGRPTIYDSVAGRVIADPARFPQVSPVLGVKGTWVQDILGGSRVDFDLKDSANFMLILDDATKTLFEKYGQATLDGQGSILLADGVFGPSYLTFDQFRYKNVIAQWATTGDAAAVWHTLQPMPANSGAFFPFGANVFDIQKVQPTVDVLFPVINKPTGFQKPDENAAPVLFVKSAKLIPSAGDDSPSNGETIWVRFISNMAPEEDVPKFLEEDSFGVLLKDIYDGVHSDPQIPPRVLYDAAAMDAMIAETPPLLAIVKETSDDLRGWVEENIYKPLGYAPALSAIGEVIPVKYALPDSSVSLILLTDSNVKSATWTHDDSNAVNKVTFTYERDLVPTRGPVGYKIVPQDVIIEDWDVLSIALFGAKAIEYNPVTCHSVMIVNGPFAQAPNITNEVGWRLGTARAADAITRFGQGAQQVTAVCDATDSDVYDAAVGDWVVLQLSWLPEYYTRTRGCNRLMQISRINKTSPIEREFTLVDAGPYLAQMTCPTVSGIAQDAYGRVSINVTAIPADTVARLEFAIGATQPPDSSGAWLLMQRTTDTGTFTLSPQAPGSKVWIRWRGEQTGRQPSDWCGVDSITIADVAQMIDVTLTLNGAVPRVSWAGLGSTLGVRILYQRHADGTAVPTVLGSTLDEPVDDNGSGLNGYADLPFSLDPLEQVTIQLVGYLGWTGSAVSGTAGYASQFLTVQYLGTPIGPPTVLPAVTVTGLLADVNLTIQSSSSTSTFTVQVKDDAGLIWDLVTSGADATPLAVAPGTVLGPTSWFHNGSTFSQLLNDIVLTAGVIRTFYAQATVVGATGITSGWVAFSMQGTTVDLTGIDFIVGTATPLLSAERVLTDTTTIVKDFGTAGQAKLKLATDTPLPGNPTAATQSPGDNSNRVATTAYADLAIAAALLGLSWKLPARFKTTANVNLAGGGLANGTTHDGVTAVTGNRVLVASQTSPTENGIYVVPASGAAVRATDADAGTELVNATCYVSEGTTNADTQWTCTTNSPITIGATSIVFAQMGSGGGAVTSVFGRTGAVVAVPGDYSVTDITGAAPLASPLFTGDPRGPTPAAGDNDTSLATTAFVYGAALGVASGGVQLGVAIVFLTTEEEFAAIPAAATEINVQFRRRRYLVGAGNFRLNVNVLVAAASASLLVHYSTDDFAASDVLVATLPLTSTGRRTTGFLVVPAGMAADVIVSLFMSGGGGTDTCVLTDVECEVLPALITAFRDFSDDFSDDFS